MGLTFFFERRTRHAPEEAKMLLLWLVELASSLAVRNVAAQIWK
jgi:hypothetical protein